MMSPRMAAAVVSTLALRSSGTVTGAVTGRGLLQLTGQDGCRSSIQCMCLGSRGLRRREPTSPVQQRGAQYNPVSPVFQSQGGQRGLGSRFPLDPALRVGVLCRGGMTDVWSLWATGDRAAAIEDRAAESEELRGRQSGSPRDFAK